MAVGVIRSLKPERRVAISTKLAWSKSYVPDGTLSMWALARVGIELSGTYP